MPLIALDQLKSGMRVMKTVQGRNGQVLVPQGLKITEPIISSLRKWGITHMEVEEDKPIDETSLEDRKRQNPEAFLQAEDEVNMLLSLVETKDEYLKELIRCCVERLINRNYKKQ
jgi:hypothetical protein